MTRQRSQYTSRAWVEVDLGALQRNGQAIAARAGVPLLPMVKADGYGLGAAAAVRALEPLAPWGYGVATIEEGRALRDAGVERPIVVFTPLLADDHAAARVASLVPALGDRESIERWQADGGGAWHLAIDTGMTRSGVRWSDVGALDALLRAHPPEGAFTHFHSAERNDGSMAAQEGRFRTALASLPARPRLVHAENSAAVARRAPSPWDLVRPGVFLYGVGSGPGAAIAPDPVAHVRARVVAVHDIADGETVSYEAAYRAVGPRRIATLAIGYADGYRRALSNRGSALLGGRRVPVAGVVTMDMTMLDVTGVMCAPGDVATLVGRDAADELPIEEVARTGDLSPYELLTGLRQRLTRVYREAS
ncbi:MAG TPA: alanine racemase [Gemmatimonadaceae bacterium]